MAGTPALTVGEQVCFASTHISSVVPRLASHFTLDNTSEPPSTLPSTHGLIRTFTHSATHPPPTHHPSTHPLTYSFIHPPPVHPSIHLSTHPCILLPAYPPHPHIHTLMCLLVHLPTHPPFPTPTPLPTHLPVYSFLHPPPFCPASKSTLDTFYVPGTGLGISLCCHFLLCKDNSMPGWVDSGLGKHRRAFSTANFIRHWGI